MGMRVHVRAVRPTDIQRLEQAEVYSSLERGQMPSVHLEKAWHGLHFLLTGSAGESGVPLGFLLEGGQEVGEDDGYGAPRLFQPGEVQQINAALAPISDDKLWGRFDAELMEAENIYPCIWDEEEEELRDEYLTYFHELKKVVAQAAEGGMGLLVTLS
ncbi:MAG TPA: YfbM family protein [Gemmataceae bacterium]|nr:YfbM family protein [Gemmataceae bacterium]